MITPRVSACIWGSRYLQHIRIGVKNLAWRSLPVPNESRGRAWSTPKLAIISSKPWITSVVVVMRLATLTCTVPIHQVWGCYEGLVQARLRVTGERH